MPASPTLVRVVQSTLATLAALGLLSLIVAQAALAGTPLNGGPAPLTGSTFQGADGNQKTPLPGDPDHVGMPARTDWQTYASSPRLSTLPDGSGLQDRWFFQGKEQEPDMWTFQHDTVSPGKADVLGAWSTTEPVSADVFLYLSFFRAAAGGTTFYNFELNQLTSTWTNSQGTVIPCRKDGDVIVTFELQGGAGDVGVRVWQWESSEPGPATCPEGKVGAWTPSASLSTDALGNMIAQGAMNTGPIANYLDFDLDGDGDPSTDPSPTSFATADTFGEAALNLSKVLAGLNNGDSCFNFGQVQLHTRSASPFTADLKDFIAPQPIIARSCAIEGTKYHDLDADGTQDAGEPGLSGFRVYADKNDSGSFEAGEPNTFTADGTQPGKPLGSWVLDSLPAGDYKIREDLTNTSGNPRATEGWTCSDPSPCHFDVPLANGGVVGGLEFGNYKKALVRIEKQTVPDGAAGSFGFTSSLPGKPAFNLTDGGVEEALVAPGVYTASETLHPDFNLTNVACTAGGQVTSPTAVQFNATSGKTITCTYTNSRKTGELTVRKVLDPTTDPGKFDLKIGSDVVVDDGGHLAQGTRTLATGTHYTVSETGGTGTSLSKYDSSVVCKDGDVTVASGSGTALAHVPVAEGRNVVCTFTNVRRPGSIEVVKDLKPGDDPGRFDLKVGDDVVKAQAGDGDSGSKSVAPGAYTVSEAGETLAKYDSSVACDNGQSGQGSSLASVTVDSNDDVTCTITNTRKKGSLTVVKDLVPAADAGRFDLRIGDEVVKAAAADGGSSTRQLAPGAYAVSELGAGDTALADYASSIACDDGKSGQGTSLSGIQIDSGDDVTCTITNTRLGKVEIEKQTVPGGDPKSFGFSAEGLSPEAFQLSDGGVRTFDRVAPNAGDAAYGVSEDAAPGYRLSAIDCGQDGDSSGSTQSRTASIHVSPGETVHCKFVNTKLDSEIAVVKTGTERAHDGDTLSYTFDVSNTGNSPLHDVAVSDNRCAPVTRVSGDTVLDPGENWTYECSYVAPAHQAGEEDPIVNTVTASAKDEQDKPVEATDKHETDLIHPDIEVVKQVDKAKAHVGDTLNYTFEVSNEGDTPLTVEFSDPRCDAGTLTGPTGDADSDQRLDASETWTYKCSHKVTGQSGDPVVNTVKVTGTDELGGKDSDEDSTETDVLHPDIEVDKQVDRQSVHVGDKLTYTFEVTNAGDTPLTVGFSDPRCDAGTLVGPDDDVLGVGETWTYECSHVVTNTDPNPLPNTAKVTGTDELGGKDSDEDSTSVAIVKPGALVVKEGNQFAYPGDTVTFTFTVTNNGNAPLTNVVVTDDRCAPVTRTSGDAALDPGETWRYTCSKQIPADHKIGDENPIRNVATATGKDSLGRTVTSTDDHKVQVLHPAVAIQKTGPATALAGSALAYTLTVTNPGDVAFASQQVIVTDPRCDAPPAGPNTNGDATPGRLDPGDRWTYTCTAQTTGQPAGTFVNTANVTAKDSNGRTVTDTDDFPTVLEAQQVLPNPEIISGRARLRGPSGCVRGPFTATVRGRRIARVTFYRDGKRIKTINAKRGQRKFTVRVKPGNRTGVHRVTARIRFRANSGTRARTLRLGYQRCRRQVVQPRFTG